MLSALPRLAAIGQTVLDVEDGTPSTRRRGVGIRNTAR